MNAPAGMRPVKAIVTDIDQWVADNTDNVTPPEDIHCNTCNTVIQQVTLYASVHDSPFSGCVGGGEVTNLALPYCPTCEPDVPAATQRTCIHATGGI